MSDQEKMTQMFVDMMEIHDPTCLKKIADTARSRRESLMQAKTLSWQLGDEVQLLPEHQGKRPFDAIGIIVKINQVKMKVKYESVTWTIPKIMLQKANESSHVAQTG